MLISQPDQVGRSLVRKTRDLGMVVSPEGRVQSMRHEGDEVFSHFSVGDRPDTRLHVVGAIASGHEPIAKSVRRLHHLRGPSIATSPGDVGLGRAHLRRNHRQRRSGGGTERRLVQAVKPEHIPGPLSGHAASIPATRDRTPANAATSALSPMPGKAVDIPGRRTPAGRVRTRRHTRRTCRRRHFQSQGAPSTDGDTRHNRQAAEPAVDALCAVPEKLSRDKHARFGIRTCRWSAARSQVLPLDGGNSGGFRRK